MANPLLNYDRSDAEDCGACEELQDTCPYHVGVLDGIDWVAGKLRTIATDPEVLNELPEPLAAAPAGGVL